MSPLFRQSFLVGILLLVVCVSCQSPLVWSESDFTKEWRNHWKEGDSQAALALFSEIQREEATNSPSRREWQRQVDIGTTYATLGMPIPARTAFQRSAEIAEAVWGNQDSRFLESQNWLAQTLLRESRREEASEILVPAYELAYRTYGEEARVTIDLLSSVAWLHESQENPLRAEWGHRQVLALDRRILGERHFITGRAMRELGTFLAKSEETHAEGLELIQGSVPLIQEHWGLDHPEALWAHFFAVVEQRSMLEEGEYSAELQAIQQSCLANWGADSAVSLEFQIAILMEDPNIPPQRVLEEIPGILERARAIHGQESGIVLLCYYVATVLSYRSGDFRLTSELTTKGLSYAKDLPWNTDRVQGWLLDFRNAAEVNAHDF